MRVDDVLFFEARSTLRIFMFQQGFCCRPSSFLNFLVLAVAFPRLLKKMKERAVGVTDMLDFWP